MTWGIAAEAYLREVETSYYFKYMDGITIEGDYLSMECVDYVKHPIGQYSDKPAISCILPYSVDKYCSSTVRVESESPLRCFNVDGERIISWRGGSQ